MTFLSPWPAIIASAITIPALLALYLLKLRRTPTKVSSTLFWQRAAKDLEANVPLRWLRPTWMLLLHLLLLGSLLLALARPAIDSGIQAPERVLILIDRSASMSMTDGPDGITRLEHAKTLARREIERLRSSGYTGAIGLASFDDRARPHAPLTPDLPIVLRALDDITPSDLPGDYDAGFRLAEALLAPVAGQTETEAGAAGEVWLFSDGGLNDADRRGAPLVLRGPGLRFFPAGPGANGEARPAIDNIGITSFTAARTHADPAKLRIALTVQSSVARPVPVTLEARLDGVLRARETLTIPPATYPEPPEEDDAQAGAVRAPRPEDDRLTPGRLPHAMVIEDLRGGLLELIIAREDSLASDNRVASMLPQASRVRAELVTPDALVGDQPAALTITRAMLESLTESEVRTRSISAYNASPTTPEQADILVFFGATPNTTPPIPTISLGAGLPAPGLGITPIESTGGRDLVTAFDRDHPVLRGVLLDRLRIRRSGTLIPPAESDDRPALLARVSEGAVIAYAERRGVRRLVVSFPVEDSGWVQQEPAYFSFLLQAVTHLTKRGEAVAGVSFRTRDAVELLPLRPGALVRITDSEGALIAQREAGELLEPVGFGRIERAGLYRATGAQVDRLPINMLDPGETAARAGSDVLVSGVRVTGASDAPSNKQEIWRWFILGAAVLLTIEWLVYSLRMRV